MRTHQEIDARSLWLHGIIAQRMRNDPTLFDRARQTLGRLLATRPVNEQPLLRQWQEIMDAGIESCIAAMTEDTESGRQRRQSAPFAGLLPPRERERLLREWSTSHAKA